LEAPARVCCRASGWISYAGGLGSSINSCEYLHLRIAIPNLCFSISSLGRLYSEAVSWIPIVKRGETCFHPYIDDTFGHFLCDSPRWNFLGFPTLMHWPECKIEISSAVRKDQESNTQIRSRSLDHPQSVGLLVHRIVIAFRQKNLFIRQDNILVIDSWFRHVDFNRATWHK
jgi:hypothetical protein